MAVDDRPRVLAHHPGLDGVRAVAVLAVLVFHAEQTWLPGGFLGVSLFFTLSGYLIVNLLVSELERSGTVSLRAFWARRLRRLAPAATVTILAVVGLASWLSSSLEQGRIRGDAVAAASYVANWRAIAADNSYAEIFANASPLQHMWSLSIEEQLYLLVPIAVVVAARLGLKRRGIGVLFAVGAAVSFAIALASDGFDRVYYGTDTRASELFVGAALACLLGPRLERWAMSINRPRAIVGPIALVAFVSLCRFVDLDSAWLVSGGFTAVALVSAVLCAGAIVPGVLRTVLSWRPLVYVGRISYGLYLLHWPVYVWLDGDRLDLDPVSLFAVRLVVTFAVAALSYRFVEMPVRQRTRLVNPRVAITSFVAGVLAAVTIPLVVLAAPNSTTIDVVPEVLSTVAPSPETSPDQSTPIESSSLDNVLVIGDSSGENVALALSNGADGQLGVVSGAVIGCPLVAVSLVFLRIDQNQDTEYCPDNLLTVADHVTDIDALVIVVSVANQWDYRPLDSDERVAVGSERYRADLDQFIEKVNEVLAFSGVPVLVLESPIVGDNPMMNGDTAEPRAAWNSVMRSWDERWHSVAVVPYADLLADPTSDEGRIERPDGTHLDATFGEALARESLIPRIREVYERTIDEMRSSGCLADGRLVVSACRVSS
jgi:peptidoglycan/LPS O-acetylase OafA/YrhL